MLYSSVLSLVFSAGLLLWALLCAIQDARQKRISNWLTLGLAALAGVFLFSQGKSLTGHSPGAVLLAMGVALAFSLPGYIRGKMGAGDVKLLAALALASSPLHVLGSVAIAAVGMLGWLFSGPCIWQRLSPGMRLRLIQLEPHRNTGLPYAPFLFFGLLFSVLLLT